MLFAFLTILSLLLLVALIPIVVLTFRHRIRFLHGVFIVAICLMLSYYTGLQSETGGQPIGATIEQNFIQLEETIHTLSPELWQRLMGTNDAEQTAQLQAERLAIYQTLFPAATMLTMLARSYLLMMMIKNLLALFRRNVSMYPLFSELMLPRGCGIALLVSIIGMMMVRGPSAAAFLNIVIIIGVVASFCGLSFVDFYVRQKIPFGVVRFLLYCFAWGLLASIGFYGLTVLALVDSTRNIRKLAGKDDGTYGEQQ